MKQNICKRISRGLRVIINTEIDAVRCERACGRDSEKSSEPLSNAAGEEAKLAMYSHLAQAMDGIKQGRIRDADCVFADIIGELEKMEI